MSTNWSGEKVKSRGAAGTRALTFGRFLKDFEGFLNFPRTVLRPCDGSVTPRRCEILNVYRPWDGRDGCDGLFTLSCDRHQSEINVHNSKIPASVHCTPQVSTLKVAISGNAPAPGELHSFAASCFPSPRLAVYRRVVAPTEVKPAFEQTPQRPWESFHCEEVRGLSYNATWHFHPEYQLTLVLQSNGYRLVGDNISPLRSGDIVLVGANLPHVWHQEEAHAGQKSEVHAIIIRFLKTFLGGGFLELPETKKVVQLLDNAGRGLELQGATRARVSTLMQDLPEKRGLARIAGLLEILELIANSRELKPVASAGFIPEVSTGDQHRLERIITYINQHVAEPIDRSKVARLASLSETAFSRFFKLRTGKTLPQYVNEVRIGRACRLLADERNKVVDIALSCGFFNLPNFNRRFLQITGLKPRDYRATLKQSVSEPFRSRPDK